jgi:hypothetical protein
MDIRFLMELPHKFASLETCLQQGLQNIQASVQNIQAITLRMQERYMMQDIRDEYSQELYAWYDFEDACDDWYMDSCHFWDDNHFHLLFDDSPSPYVEHIMERSPTPSMNTIFQYSPVLVCYSDDFVDMEGSTYLDPHDQCRSLEHHFQLVLEFRYLPRGVHMSTWTWDPGSQWKLDYFSMMVFISPWDPGSLVYFNTMVHTYPWDPGIWLYIKH